MLRRLYVISFLVFVAANAVCQAKQKLSFSSINQVGLLSGEKGEAFTAQTINGIKKGKWFAGVGVGLDLYDSKTIPLFIDVRKNFGNHVNSPFVYADGGINFLRLTSIDKVQTTNRKTSPGLYYDLGVGWKLSLKNDRAFLISAGFNFKQVKEQYKTWGAPTDVLAEENYDRYNYSYRRVVLKLGLQL